MLFAAMFWGVVVAIIVGLSYVVPALKGRSCLTRILFGLGFVPGCVGGMMVVGFFWSEISAWYEGVMLFGSMALGGATGAFLGSRLGIAVDDSVSRARVSQTR